MTRPCLAGLIVAVTLVMPATASAQDDGFVTTGSPEHIEYECGIDPARQTVEEWNDSSPPTREQALEDFSPFPGSTEDVDAQREAYWQAKWAAWLEERASWEEYKARDQARYAECVARIKKEQADYERKEAKSERARERAERARRKAARLRCARIGNRRIWKNRRSVSCHVARKLARVSRTHKRFAGWRRASYVHGYGGYRVMTRVDAYGEIHSYRVPTDPYIQAIWRKGSRRVIVGSGGCDGMC